MTMFGFGKTMVRGTRSSVRTRTFMACKRANCSLTAYQNALRTSQIAA